MRTGRTSKPLYLAKVHGGFYVGSDLILSVNDRTITVLHCSGHEHANATRDSRPRIKVFFKVLRVLQSSRP